MESVGEKGSRILDDAAELLDLLRLAQSAAHRIQNDVHGSDYECAEKMVSYLHELREDAETMFKNMENFVKELEKNRPAD